MKKIFYFLLLVSFFQQICNAQNVGIGNTNPQAKLDIAGDVRLRSTLLTLPAGLNNNVDINTVKSSVYMFAGGALGGCQITGFSAGVDGRFITIFNNSTTAAIQLYDQSNATNPSAAANKILTGTGNSAIIYQNGSVTLRYDGAKQRWTIIGSNYTDGLSASGSSTGQWNVTGNNIFNTNTGNVGVGTNNPTAKLDVNGTFRIANGTQALGKVLTSDVNGIATWQSASSANSFWNGDDKINDDYSFQTTYPLSNKIVQINSPVIGTGGGRGTYKGGGLNIYNPTVGLIQNYITFDGQNIKARHLDFTGSGADEVEDNLLLNSYGGNVGIGYPVGFCGPTHKLSIGGYNKDAAGNSNVLQVAGTNPMITISDLGFGSTYAYIKGITSLTGTPQFSNYGLEIGNGGYSNDIYFTGNGYQPVLMIKGANNNVGIGTNNPTSKLSVNGNIRSKEVVVETGWADYVFDDEYKLPSLKEVEKYIGIHNHLPNMPSAADVQSNGLKLGEVQTKMMEKIEELTLYIIDLQKQISTLKSAVNEKK